jgi:putative phosphoesterase
MLVGIMSDSHGRHLAVRAAVALFDSLGVRHLVHCGDVGGSDVFDELIGRPFDFVWGNTDQADDGLVAYLSSLGVKLPEASPVVLELDGSTLAVFHGHEPAFSRALRELQVDYILHGHTHAVRDERRRRTRIINPGALHRATPKTVATLDTQTDVLTFHEIKSL